MPRLELHDATGQLRAKASALPTVFSLHPCRLIFIRPASLTVRDPQGTCRLKGTEKREAASDFPIHPQPFPPLNSRCSDSCDWSERLSTEA